MKNFSKVISIFLILIISVPTSAFAAPDTQYADTLYELGLDKLLEYQQEALDAYYSK